MLCGRLPFTPFHVDEFPPHCTSRAHWRCCYLKTFALEVLCLEHSSSLACFLFFFFLNLHPHWECLKSAGTCVHTNALVKFSIWILPYETLELLFNVPHSPFRRQTPGRHAALGGFVYFILLQSLLALQLRSHVIENKRKKRVDCLKLQYWGCSSCLEIRMGNRKCIPLFFWISARVIFS